jgi:formylglycine-generating enzyme required for sulfatase activity
MKTRKSNLLLIFSIVVVLFLISIITIYNVFISGLESQADQSSVADRIAKDGINIEKEGWVVISNLPDVEVSKPPRPGTTKNKTQASSQNLNPDSEIVILKRNLESKDLLITDIKIKQEETKKMLDELLIFNQESENKNQASAIKIVKLKDEKMVLSADLAKLMQEKASLLNKIEMFTPENIKKMEEQIFALNKNKNNLEEFIQIQKVDDKAKMIEISNLNQKISLLNFQLANINIPHPTNIDTVNLPNNVKLEMVLIPSGKFTMGSPIPDSGREFETQHEATITKPYYMGKFEVTQEQWEAVMGTNPSFTKGKDLPVTNVSWKDCQEFIKMLNKETGYGFRLPSEREWEYACRARTTTAFSFGDNITTKDANFGGSIGPLPVGKYLSNSFGLYDMHGNVWEWCETEHLVKERVFRGGSYKSDDSKYLRSYHRFWGDEDFRDPINGGFRLVKTK